MKKRNSAKKYVFRNEVGSLITRFIKDSDLESETSYMQVRGYTDRWSVHEYRKLGGKV